MSCVISYFDTFSKNNVNEILTTRDSTMELHVFAALSVVAHSAVLRGPVWPSVGDANGPSLSHKTPWHLVVRDLLQIKTSG